MRKKHAKVTDQLRTAIETSGKTLGQIARESGIDIATISRFMHGKGGLSMDGLDGIAESLGLHLSTGAPARQATRPVGSRATQARAKKGR